MKYLIRLYKALHPEDKKTTEADISNVTLKNVMTNDIFNDLGFQVGKKIVILVEAQSTWTENILIRMLMYLLQTYTRYFEESNADLYGEKKIDIPEPELYVIYTGNKKNIPEYLTFQESYFNGKSTALNVRIKIITNSHEGDIINQYIRFTRILDEQIKKYGRTKKAIIETIRICKHSDILIEYLAEREKEVIGIMEALFDEQRVIDNYVTNKTKEALIQETVEECKHWGRTSLEAIDRIIEKYGLTRTSAKTKVNKYWK